MPVHPRQSRLRRVPRRKRRGSRRSLYSFGAGLSVGSLVLGLLLSYALDTATSGAPIADAGGAPDSSSSPTLDASGTPVIDEVSLGPETQAIALGSNLGVQLDFDVDACLADQGVSQNVIALEQVRWQKSSVDAWLIVYSERTAEDVQGDGGVVHALVVRPGCGNTSGDSSVPYWAGDVVFPDGAD